jgi:prepilin-type N-terminal cleavage/methylation domain-containing protein
MKWYAESMKHKGFTVVELIIVIVVIAILASIVIVSYSFMTTDAMDTKIRSAVRTVGDAIQLYESRNNGALPASGHFSSSDPQAVDTLLIPGYLKQGYRDGITSKNVNQPVQIFKVYPCNDTGGGFVIYASLNNPTTDDTSMFTTIRTACGHTNTHAPNTATKPIYNYAQKF